MREEILTCDRCKQRVKWLYNIDALTIKGLKVDFNGTYYELCKPCAEKLIGFINDFCDVSEEEKHD